MSDTEDITEYNDLGFELYDNDQCLTVYRAKENIPRE